MGDVTKKQGYAYFAFVTRIDFDPEKSYPKMRFKAIQALSEVEAKKVLELREDPISYRIIGGDTTGRLAASAVVQHLAAPGNTGLVQLAEGESTPIPNHPPPPAVDPAIAAASAKFEEERRARLAAIRKEAAELEAAETKPVHTLELKANPTQPAPQTVTIETGLGETKSPAGAGLQAETPSGQTATTSAAPADTRTVAASDTGEPEQADAALDDAINALLPK
jgi:hypothetical protein